MNTTKLKFLKKYYPLLDHSAKPLYSREEAIRRLLNNEEISLADIGVTEIVSTSGRVSGKTQHGEIAAITDLTRRKGDIWYCRSEDADIRNSVLASTLNTITKLGFTYSNNKRSDFKVSYSPFTVTYNANGNQIQYFGINKDINRTKGKVPPSGHLQRVILEEANEPDDGIYVDALRTTAVRFLDVGSVFEYRYNPPMTKQHWAFQYYDKRVREYGAKKIYTTWEDLAREQLLEPATIADILQTQKNDPLMYRYWYMGEVVILVGLVYPQFKRERHCVNVYDWLIRGDHFTELTLGLDEGTVNDSTCVTALATMASGRTIVLDLYEHSPTDRTGQLGVVGQFSPSEQSRDLHKWLENLFLIFPALRNVPRQWIFESAEGGQMLRNQFVADYGEPTCLVTKKSIWGDVKRVRNMLSEDLLFFHIAPNVNTDTLCRDIENYVIDERTNDIKANQREDTIDSLEYATKLYYDKPLRR